MSLSGTDMWTVLGLHISYAYIIVFLLGMVAGGVVRGKIG